tara:strand:+ start:1046 stop:2023 length:978 start_codon:yes stop_codon:yes gene_type:complete
VAMSEMEKERGKEGELTKWAGRKAFMHVFYTDGTKIIIATSHGYGWAHQTLADDKVIDVAKTLEGNKPETLGVRINVKNSYNNTAFVQAAILGNTTLMELILCLSECIPFVPSPPGPLYGDEAFKFCDRHKDMAVPGYVRIDKRVCLMCLSFSHFFIHGLFAQVIFEAIKYGQVNSVKFLAKNCPWLVHLFDVLGVHCPIHYAIKADNLEMVMALSEAGSTYPAYYSHTHRRRFPVMALCNTTHNGLRILFYLLKNVGLDPNEVYRGLNLLDWLFEYHYQTTNDHYGFALAISVCFFDLLIGWHTLTPFLSLCASLEDNLHRDYV